MLRFRTPPFPKAMHCVALAALFVFATWGAKIFADESIEGIYQGEITYYENDAKIPLLLSLALKKNPSSTSASRYEIVGSFIMDDEGGPHPFAAVAFEFDTSRIDMVYRRPETIRTRNIPADVRFTGEFLSFDEIEGRVVMGRRGPVGTFRAVKKSDVVFAPKQKYVGYWSGSAETVTGANRSFAIHLAATEQPFANPEDMDLEFTAGKIGYLMFDRVKMEFEKVYIDYVERRMVLIHRDKQNGAVITLEGVMDFDSGIMRGTIDSSFRGRTGRFAVRLR